MNILNKISLLNQNEKSQKEETADSLERYIKRNGYHFTDELADIASDITFKTKKWMPKEVMTYLNTEGYNSTTCNHTNGDVTFVSNWLYTLLYPSILSKDKDCIRSAKMILSDPTSFEGRFFKDWIAVIKTKSIDIDFDQY